eukprot:TRINITY_DN79320_c0_g1_i1.p1 TRINITY_DN79320_c0_g1~~TRINITY_DN79320_c0_g1_i1.p1  ORF type:complete len:666 (-),score=137.86 TRINITY_DN79320_c0_g1_i1:4-2001(-)
MASSTTDDDAVLETRDEHFRQTSAASSSGPSSEHEDYEFRPSGRWGARLTRKFDLAQRELERMMLRSSTKSKTIGTSFIGPAAGNDDCAHFTGRWRQERITAHRLITHPVVEVLMSIVASMDFIIILVDTDRTAAGEPGIEELTYIVYFAYIMYAIEFIVMLFILQRRIFSGFQQRLNFFLLLAGIAEYAMKDSSLTPARVLRILRLFRMLRVVQKFTRIKDLRRLLQMIANCSRCLLWSFGFCFCIMMMWSVLAVEMIHPVVQDLYDRGEWSDCESCRDAFSSVMLANLTFFKTCIAGDSWGLLAVPVIKEAPYLSLIFVGVSLTVTHGLLVLANAVVVDTFAEQRQKDEKMMAEEMELDLTEDIKFWTGVFANIDSDENGFVDLEELITGAKKDENFRSRLRILDIDENDLENLFGMLDADDGGTIDVEEFVTALSRWRHDSKTANRFSKYNIMRLLDRQGDIHQQVELLNEKVQGIKNSGYANMTMLSEKIDTCVEALDHLLPKGRMEELREEGPSGREFYSGRRSWFIPNEDGFAESLPPTVGDYNEAEGAARSDATRKSLAKVQELVHQLQNETERMLASPVTEFTEASIQQGSQRRRSAASQRRSAAFTNILLEKEADGSILTSPVSRVSFTRVTEPPDVNDELPAQQASTVPDQGWDL